MFAKATGRGESVLSPDFQVYLLDVDAKGNPVAKRWSPLSPINRQSQEEYTIPRPLDYQHYNHDYVDLKRNITSNKAGSIIMGQEPALVEIVIVVDKEFGDIFKHDYYKIVDYLSVYFWDVNMRYKSLPSVDISFKVNGLLIMESTQAQPFIEQARASDGRTEFNRILSLYKQWIYQQRSWLVRHDLAPLITASQVEWGGGLAHGSGTCWVDDNNKVDLGTCVWNDDGSWGSVTVGVHELAHTLGAPHDDDPEAKCPGPYGFIMSGGNDQYRYFFSECSNQKISSFVSSNSASCLRRIDGYSTTPMDPKFSTPKAPDMVEQCKKHLNNPNAWVEQQDTLDCKTLRCKRRDDSNPNAIWTHFFSPVENSICGSSSGGGRCFRGRCRNVGKLIKNEKDGNCIIVKEYFGYMIPVKMGKCPTSRDKTLLDTLEVRDVLNGKMLASPYMNDGNKDNGDRCLYTGVSDNDPIWTDRCNADNPWQAWEFRSVGGDGSRFLLVHKVTGRCAIPDGGDGAYIRTIRCDEGNNRMIWNLSDGN